MLMASQVSAYTLIYYDDFGNDIISPWTVLKSESGLYVYELYGVMNIVIPSSCQDWASGALKFPNNINFNDGTEVWIYFTNWDNYGAGGYQYYGPRLVELVLSNEVYSPMSSHRRYTIRWEIYNYAASNRIFATKQIGTNQYSIGQTLYNKPTDYPYTRLHPYSGNAFALGFRRQWDPYTQQTMTRFYFWCEYNNNVYTIGYDYGWIFSSNYPYIIFGAYGYHADSFGYYGRTQFDNFMVMHD